MTSLTKLLPCPFCGSTNVDPEGWATLPEYAKTPEERSGPACDDCGASAKSVERWNTRSGRLRVSDELDAATVEKKTTEIAKAHGCDRGTFTVCWAEHERGAICQCKQEAIRSLIPNSAGDARTTHLQGEGEPVVKQAPSPAGTVSELNSQYAGLEALLAAIHADDPKRELLVRVGDLMRENRVSTRGTVREKLPPNEIRILERLADDLKDSRRYFALNTLEQKFLAKAARALLSQFDVRRK